MQTTATRPTPCHRARLESDARDAERAEDRAEANAEAKAAELYQRYDAPAEEESYELDAIVADAEAGIDSIEDSIPLLKRKLDTVRELVLSVRMRCVRGLVYDRIERAEAWLAVHDRDAAEGGAL